MPLETVPMIEVVSINTDDYRGYRASNSEITVRRLSRLTRFAKIEVNWNFCGSIEILHCAELPELDD